MAANMSGRVSDRVRQGGYLTVNDGTKVEILRDGILFQPALARLRSIRSPGRRNKTLMTPTLALVTSLSGTEQCFGNSQAAGVSDDSFTVAGTGSTTQTNNIKLSFSEDDTYNFSLVFDDKPNSGATSSINKQLDISATTTGNSASAIADAINAALANNALNGADMSGVASVSVSGNELTLRVNDGSKVEILRSGERISTGNGQLTINPLTIGGSTKTLADAPVISASGKSLVDQRLILSDLPDEELIVFIGDQGAKRLAMQFDEQPESAPKLTRDIEIRVKDAETRTLEFFDFETQTSIATRTLDVENKTSAVGFDFELDGTFDADDKFHINSNTSGTGDNRNLQAILDLQNPPSDGRANGGFQKTFNNAVSRLGAIVQSGKIAAESAVSLREASIEAESAYSGVNLDTEAANLIQQQQAYQASARILSTARELFETLLQVV